MLAYVMEIPGYRVQKIIGMGGMASVYLAVQESLDREVALKVMSVRLAENHEFMDRFLKEGKLTAKLSHPNLVTVYDIGHYGEFYYLAQELIPGGTLREKMYSGMNVVEILDVVCDVANGLAYAHERGIVHRDVKPGNVLFRANGTAVLADFGIAKMMNSRTSSTQNGNSIGTPHYMSPEQAQAGKIDGRSDLYSLGAMMYEMLTGVPPFNSDDPFTIALMHVTAPVPQLPENFRWLQGLLDKLMAKSPEERFETGDDLVRECDEIISRASEARAMRETQHGRKRTWPRLLLTQTTEPVFEAIDADATHPLPLVTQSRSMVRVIAILMSVFLVGLFVVWWLGLKNGAFLSADTRELTGTQIKGTVMEESENAGLESVDTDSSILMEDVDSLLVRARNYVETGINQNGRRFTTPIGDSALDLYQSVLKMDPENPEAQRGLDRIADYYESKARALLDRGFASGCFSLAEEDLKADPMRKSLIALRDQQCQLDR